MVLGKTSWFLQYLNCFSSVNQCAACALSCVQHTPIVLIPVACFIASFPSTTREIYPKDVEIIMVVIIINPHAFGSSHSGHLFLHLEAHH